MLNMESGEREKAVRQSMHEKSQRDELEKEMKGRLDEYVRQSVLIKRDKEELVKKLSEAQKQNLDKDKLSNEIIAI